jgi:hypothetical protein
VAKPTRCNGWAWALRVSDNAHPLQQVGLGAASHLPNSTAINSLSLPTYTRRLANAGGHQTTFRP